MKTRAIQLFTAAFFLFAAHLYSQTIPKEELVFLTSSWEGERFEDGRPKISDDLVERAKHISVDDAWTVLKNEGYKFDTISESATLNEPISAGTYKVLNDIHDIEGDVIVQSGSTINIKEDIEVFDTILGYEVYPVEVKGTSLYITSEDIICCLFLVSNLHLKKENDEDSRCIKLQHLFLVHDRL